MLDAKGKTLSQMLNVDVFHPLDTIRTWDIIFYIARCAEGLVAFVANFIVILAIYR